MGWVFDTHPADSRVVGPVKVAGTVVARYGTAYFHDYIYGKAEIRFLRGRLHFEDEDGNRFPPAPFP